MNQRFMPPFDGCRQAFQQCRIFSYIKPAALSRTSLDLAHVDAETPIMISAAVSFSTEYPC